jgi:HAD superfamily hydrolase (TIGR01458 family)
VGLKIDSKKLLQKKVFLLDVEGVLCDEIDNGKVFPFAAEFVKNLKKAGKKVSVVSNISRKPSTIVFSRLKSMGLSLTETEVSTAGAATARYVKRKFPDARCFVISEWGLRTDLEKQGMILVSEGDADVVLIGVDRRVSYPELNHAARLVMNGAKLICVGTTMMFKGTFLGESGMFLGETPFANAISLATKTPITYIGKPYPEIFLQTMANFGARANDTIMVGDSLSSDIKGANSAGIESIFITKGDKFDIKKIPKEERPTFVARDLKELNDLMFG